MSVVAQAGVTGDTATPLALPQVLLLPKAFLMATALGRTFIR